jgi:hypothetical protein
LDETGLDPTGAVSAARTRAAEQEKAAAADVRQAQAAVPVPALQNSEDFVAALRARGGADSDRIGRNFAALAAFVKGASARMGIAEPRLLVDTTAQSRYAAGMAAASPNKSGTLYFMIVDGKRLAEILASERDLDWFKVIVCHEMDHIKRGDVTPAALGAPSDPDRIESQEVRADIEGGYYAGDPAPMAAYFKAELIADAAKCKAAAPEAPAFKAFDPSRPTAEQIRQGSAWRKEQDPLHAEPLERYFVFARLAEMAANGSAGTVEDVAAENGPLRKAVRREMQDRSLPDWSGTASADGTR